MAVPKQSDYEKRHDRSRKIWEEVHRQEKEQLDRMERKPRSSRRDNTRSDRSPMLSMSPYENEEVERKIIRALAEQERKLRQQFEAETQDRLRLQSFLSDNSSNMCATGPPKKSQAIFRFNGGSTPEPVK